MCVGVGVWACVGSVCVGVGGWVCGGCACVCVCRLSLGRETMEFYFLFFF